MSRLAPSVEEIEARLRAALPISALQIRDDSAQHHGHAGAAAGGGHFHVTVVSSPSPAKAVLPGTGLCMIP